MKETTTDIFEMLKRTRSLITRKKSASAVFFQLSFDVNGAYLSVINEKGNADQPWP